MTPRDVLAMVAARREEQREDRRYSDMLQARQTANSADLLFKCLYGIDIYPIDAHQFMAVEWDQPQPITTTTTEPADDDDEIDQELLMQQSMIMRGMMRRKGGSDGSN